MAVIIIIVMIAIKCIIALVIGLNVRLFSRQKCGSRKKVISIVSIDISGYF